MQRDGEADLQRLGSESPDARDNSRGGDRHVPRPEADSPRGIQNPDSAQEVVVIRHRLAHPHENDVVDFLASQRLDPQELPHDFPGREVALPPVEPARAKFAAIRAAHLARNANRAAVGRLAVEGGGRGDQDGFNHLPVIEPEEKFSRGVRSAALPDDFHRGDRQLGGEFFAERRGQVRHVLPPGNAAFVKPLQDLAGTESRFAEEPEATLPISLIQRIDFHAGYRLESAPS